MGSGILRLAPNCSISDQTFPETQHRLAAGHAGRLDDTIPRCHEGARPSDFDLIGLLDGFGPLAETVAVQRAAMPVCGEQVVVRPGHETQGYLSKPFGLFLKPRRVWNATDGAFTIESKKLKADR